MCRHERDQLLRVLVSPGRRPLRPASRCAHQDRARVRQSDPHEPGSQPIRRPGGLTPSGPFLLSGSLEMKTKSSVLLAAALIGIALFSSRVSAQSLSGLWDATVVVNDNLDVPFRMEFSGSGSAA